MEGYLIHYKKNQSAEEHKYIKKQVSKKSGKMVYTYPKDSSERSHTEVNTEGLINLLGSDEYTDDQKAFLSLMIIGAEMFEQKADQWEAEEKQKQKEAGEKAFNDLMKSLGDAVYDLGLSFRW